MEDVVRRMLIVDDDPDFGCGLAELIETHFLFKTKIVQDAEEALVELSRQSYAIAIIDQVLPEMNGIELARIVRTNMPACVIILCTGYPTPLQHRPADLDAQIPVLHKPLNPLELQAVLSID